MFTIAVMPFPDARAGMTLKTIADETEYFIATDVR